jgi:uncharacterized protein (DUF58 family)
MRLFAVSTDAQVRSPQRATVAGALIALATRDHFPHFSRRVRAFLASPLGWLVLASLLAATCAVLVSPRVWPIFVSLIALISVGLVWPWLTLRTLRLWLAFARDRAIEGESVRVTARVENFSFLPALGLSLRGDLQTGEDDACGGELSARLPHCAAWRETECHWKFTPGHRGVFPLRAPCLETGFPFGLWQTRRKAESPPDLIVWPATFPVSPVPVSATEALLDGNVSRNRAGSESEFMGVRPYRRGDSPRRIHWAQSARHDRLIVCELESTARPTVRIVLDLDSAIHTSGAQGSREWAIRIAASFAKGWIEAGAQVSLLAEGVDLPLGSGDVQVRRMLDALAKLPRASTLSLDDLMNRNSRHSAGAGVSVIVTTDQRCRELKRRGFFDLRWVVMKSGHFSVADPSRSAPKSEKCDVLSGRAPWLTVESPEQARYALRHGWTEARNGS